MSVDVFLICDHQVFELAVRGRLDDRQGVGSIDEAIGHLPSGCTAVVDLGVVEALSIECALALVERFAHGPAGRLELVVAASEPKVRAALVDAGLERVAILVGTLDQARRVVGSRPPALL